MKYMSDEDGVTMVSVSNLSRLHSQGYNLVRLSILGGRTSDIECIFELKKNESTLSYSASGFSIGYGGEGPHGLYNAISLWLPEMWNNFNDSGIAALSPDSSYELNSVSKSFQVLS